MVSSRVVSTFLLWLIMLVAVPNALAAGLRVTGTIQDAQGRVVQGAEVVLTTPDHARVVSTRSDGLGRFAFDDVAQGPYLLVVRASQFVESRRSLAVDEAPLDNITVSLDVSGFSDRVTVTASRDAADDADTVAQAVNVIGREEIAARVKTVMAQAVEAEEGVALQRTSPTMAGVFVRGLTGNKVNVFVDGVRYSNGAQRGGVNTFLNLIDSGSTETIEILRGPSSTQYGSDALGGSVQFLSGPPSLSAGAARHHAFVTLGGSTAHRSGGTDATWGYEGTRVGLTASASARAVGLMRPGDGVDSHAAVTRFLGVSSDTLMDARLPDTGFSQTGASLRSLWRVSNDTRLVASYFHNQIDGGKRYDQLLGGDGNLIASLNDVSLDLFYVRAQRVQIGPFDSASLTYSLNSQYEERVNQGGNGNPAAVVGHEPERTTVHGLQGIASRRLTNRLVTALGGDVSFEHLTSDAFNVNPQSGATSVRRPRIPDQAAFQQGGVFARASFEAQPGRLRLEGAVRGGGASYEARAADAPIVDGKPLWPDDQLTVGSVTFRAGAVFTPQDAWTATFSVSRGFRAPHMTDLGTLGLTGAGFEVAAPDVAGLDAHVGTTADLSAVSSGRPVEQLVPESSVTYDGSIRYRRGAVDADVTLFVNNVHGNIQKVALVLPPGAVGLSLGGTPIIAQNANGIVFVSATTVPVLVRVNFDTARIWGIEHSARVRLGPRFSVRSAFTYLRSIDRATRLPPNIEGGTPAPELWLSGRYSAASGRYWVEPYAHFGWTQTHLSSLDLGDRRIGAGRSRANIQSFFRNGAAARGWIAPGPDGAMGTSDDVLRATGETLAQVQDRVLGRGVNSAPLFAAIPGYQTYGVRTGLRFPRHDLIVDLENLNDANYRGMSWGVDAPGLGVSVKFNLRF